MHSFIECENLVKIYKIADLEVVALQGLELTIEKGHMIALIGPSGSGKSTLMNILGGLDIPSAGTVRVGKYDLLEMSQRDKVMYRRDGVGFIWQQTARNLVPYLTALENIELPMAFNGISGKKRRQRALELIELIQLTERMNHTPSKLSGGEQQRTALAVALANNPELLLADEPTGEVDSEAANAIFDTMHTLNDAYGTTIVIVTHDHNVANRVDRIIGMRDGRASIEVLRRQNGRGVDLTQEEFAVIDRTGWLQLPQHYVEALDIEKRVRINLLDDHISIHPDTGQEMGGENGT